jgi:membrane protease YdiL (CAAX protease family)
MGGCIVILTRLGCKHWLAFLIALLLSSALFSAAHHIGPTGDPFSADVFTYRLLAGAAFGIIFYFRSLAHAVYVHTFYDIYVYILHAK